MCPKSPSFLDALLFGVLDRDRGAAAFFALLGSGATLVAVEGVVLLFSEVVDLEGVLAAFRIQQNVKYKFMRAEQKRPPVEFDKN